MNVPPLPSIINVQNMKQQLPTEEKNEQIKEWLKELPSTTILTAQCASLCSLFISGSLISATISELVSELNKRHKGMVDVNAALEFARDAIEFGTMSGIFEKEGSKYTPTETGWGIGQDWERKMRLGWNA